jgi:dihydrofolate synthase/folylpolyglutamate synthase
VTEAVPLPTTLSGWLAYIEALHPKTIEMGLGRVSKVVRRLNLNPNFPIITVTGTNGKGSACAMLSQIYIRAGYKAACYTSPHLLRYNERVKINDIEATDHALIQAFTAVEQARQDVPLTYFEMGTLAAMWYFIQQQVDVAILEVGLGGRLDAVNVFEPDCAIVTSVDLDHMDYLGSTREQIGLEKAGVFRAGKPAICGDPQPPQSLRNYAGEIGAKLQCIGQAMLVTKTRTGWQYQDESVSLSLPLPSLQGDFQLNNAVCAVRAVMQLNQKLPVSTTHIQEAMRAVHLAGRFQLVGSRPQIILDVAHNPQAARTLADNLAQQACNGRTLAVFAMLSDKDIGGVIQALLPQVSVWFVVSIDAPRGERAHNLQQRLQAFGAEVSAYGDVGQAMQAAYQVATENDKIVVFGSFYTVAAAMTYLQKNTTAIHAK